MNKEKRKGKGWNVPNDTIDLYVMFDIGVQYMDIVQR